MLEANREGDLDVVKILAEADPETVTAADRFIALGLVCQAGSVEFMQYLLSKGLTLSTHEPWVVSSITICMTSSPFSGFIFNSGMFSQLSEATILDAFAIAMQDDNFLVMRSLFLR